MLEPFHSICCLKGSKHADCFYWVVRFLSNLCQELDSLFDDDPVASVVAGCYLDGGVPPEAALDGLSDHLRVGCAVEHELEGLGGVRRVVA